MQNKSLKLKIFNNNTNNKYKLIPFNIKLSDYRSKYEAPVSKEWKNTVFSYYKNNIKNIPVNHINLNKIVKSYFNLYFLPKYLRIKRMSRRRRYSLLRRIHVSNVEIKQTNNKAIITLYILNTDKKRMFARYLTVEILKRFKFWYNEYLNILEKEIYTLNNKKINFGCAAPASAQKIWDNFKIFLSKSQELRKYKHSKRYNRWEKYYLNSIFPINKHLFKLRDSFKILFKTDPFTSNVFMLFYFFELKNYYFKHLLYNLKYKSYQEIKLRKKIQDLKKKYNEWNTYVSSIKKCSKIISNYKFLFKHKIYNINYLNYRKYSYPYKLFIRKLNKTYFYLYKLNNFFTRILNKKIEFNIITLKSLVFNADIFTKALTLKLRKKRFFPVMRGIRKIINRAKLPRVITNLERINLKKDKDLNLLNNKYKDTHLFSSSVGAGELLNFFLKEIQINKNNLKSDSDLLTKEEIISTSIFNSIRHKNIGGIRLEVKGRLTRRYRADRAIYKLRWKGGLNNIESSFNKLSSVLYRGHFKPNVTYSLSKSKRRVGAFAVKGWLSGK